MSAENETKSLWQDAQEALNEAIGALDLLYQRDAARGAETDPIWAEGGEVDAAIKRIGAMALSLEARNTAGPNPDDPRPGWGAYHGQFQGEAHFVWDFITDVLDAQVYELRAQDKWADVVKASRAMLTNPDGCERLGYYLAQYLQEGEEV
jgi:hypothetical protein